MFNTNDTTIVCIDLQEKLVNMLSVGETIAQNSKKLIQAADILNIPTLITEQYPKGLGSTVFETNAKTIEKTTFSILRTENFDKINTKNVIIFGIETHICVLQSVIDLLNEGCSVFVVEDCSHSRSENNHKTALELMKQYGAKIVTLEIVLFNFLKSSKHPNFKEIQALIK